MHVAQSSSQPCSRTCRGALPAVVHKFSRSPRRCHRAGVFTRRADPERKERTPQNPQEITEKYGLEAGLWNTIRNKSSGISAKDLLKRYGGAYLLTSISLSIVSFTLCYLAVDRGVDMASLVARIGITSLSESTQEKAGTVALAYAAHKALSPVRFPPTVALTPVVARKLFKKEVGNIDPLDDKPLD